MSFRTRDEHLAFAKKRALQYLDAGEIANAMTSMLSDLDQNPATKGGYPEVITQLGFRYAIDGDAAAMRRWIEGFR